MVHSLGHSFSYSSYLPWLSPAQEQQLFILSVLIAKWNDKINLVSRKDIAEVHLRHIVHSMAIARVQSFHSGAHVLDLGTGGGFPGLPLAIAFPETRFLLVDSIGKKVMVVQEIIQTLGLKNAVALQARAENLQEKFDYVISRAVAPLDQIVEWTKLSIREGAAGTLANGWLLLKGGDLDSELATYRKSVQLFALSDFWKDPFFDTKSMVYLPFRFRKNE